jgi:hypothetical protein
MKFHKNIPNSFLIIFPTFKDPNYFLLAYFNILHNSFSYYFPISLTYYFFTFYFFLSPYFLLLPRCTMLSSSLIVRALIAFLSSFLADGLPNSTRPNNISTFLHFSLSIPNRPNFFLQQHFFLSSLPMGCPAPIDPTIIVGEEMFWGFWVSPISSVDSSNELSTPASPPSVLLSLCKNQRERENYLNKEK